MSNQARRTANREMAQRDKAVNRQWEREHESKLDSVLTVAGGLIVLVPLLYVAWQVIAHW